MAKSVFAMIPSAFQYVVVQMYLVFVIVQAYILHTQYNSNHQWRNLKTSIEEQIEEHEI